VAGVVVHDVAHVFLMCSQCAPKYTTGVGVHDVAQVCLCVGVFVNNNFLCK
jgi:hypothetical protein